jgi:hypothetical protein
MALSFAFRAKDLAKYKVIPTRIIIANNNVAEYKFSLLLLTTFTIDPIKITKKSRAPM